MDDIVLAVSEAATNVALHAYGDRPGSVTIVARLDDDARLQVHIARPRLRHHAGGRGADARPRAVAHGARRLRRSRSSAAPLGTDVVMCFDLTDEHERRTPSDFGAAS